MQSTADQVAQGSEALDAPTIQGWDGLLTALSSDELVRYGQIALDQYRRELRYWWAQVLMVTFAAASAALAMRGLVIWGFGRLSVLSLGLPALLSYWPYRSAKTRKLWWGHYTAVLAEQARRDREREAEPPSTAT